MEDKKDEKQEKKVDLKHSLKLYYGFAKNYRWYFVGISFLLLIIGLAQIVDKFLLKEIIDRGTELTAGTIGLQQFWNVCLIVLIIFASMVAVKSIAQWFQLHLINRLDINIMYDLKRKFFNHIVGLSHRFHTTHKTGSLISRLGRGSRAIESITDFVLFNGAPLLLQLVIVGSSIYLFDKASAIALVITSLVFVSFSLLISMRVQKLRLAANDAEDIEKANIGDVLTNIDSVKYYGKENRIKGIFAKLSGRTKTAMLKSWDPYRWLEAGQTLITWVGAFFLVLFPLLKFVNGEITIGTIAFIYTAYFNLMGPLFGFVWGVRRVYEATADFQALFEYDKIKNEIEDAPSAKKLVVHKGKVEYKKVSFAYHTKKAIDEINLTINPNEKVALVGHSGCGKTTLIKLLYRLYDVGEGEILIDGKNIKKIKQESLRGELSIVPQECILFDDTIYNNIAFSRPSASRAEIMQAIKFAQLDKFVEDMPNKENTIVGERGVKLSGGEKQRVSIARAILANKKILVLDEATSALDSETEAEIQKALERLMKGRTSIMIAHRLSTIMKADKIIVLDKGKIIQAGKHEELIKERGMYKHLWNLQKGGYLKD